MCGVEIQVLVFVNRRLVAAITECWPNCFKDLQQAVTEASYCV